MERQIFKWDKWDKVEEGCYQFYDCVLIIKVDKYPIDTLFTCVTVDFNNAVMTFWNNDGTEVLMKKKMVLTLE